METKRKTNTIEANRELEFSGQCEASGEQIVSIHTDMVVVNNQPMNRTIVHLKGDRMVELRQRMVEVQGNQVPEFFWFKLPPLPKD